MGKIEKEIRNRIIGAILEHLSPNDEKILKHVFEDYSYTYDEATASYVSNSELLDTEILKLREELRNMKTDMD